MLWVQEHEINANDPKCVYSRAYWRTRPNMNLVKVGETTGTGINKGVITYVNADSAGKYKGTQAYGNGVLNNPKNLITTESQSGYSNGYTLKRNAYMGNSVDINDYRQHCTSAAAWTSKWYAFPPFKLTALYQGSDQNIPLPYGQRKKLLICFRGFGCEGRTYKYEYTMQRGCPAGKYEDPNIRWIKKRTYYEFTYSHIHIYTSIYI